MSGTRAVSFRLRCDEDAPARAREFVAIQLLAWSAGTFLDVISLLVSELVHETMSRTPCPEVVLDLETDDRVVRVTLTDEGPGVDEWEGQDESTELRTLLADLRPLRWGREVAGAGSSTWFEVEC